MKFKDLSGRIYGKNLQPYKRISGQSSKSKGQSELGNILEELYPNVPLYEEVPCVGTKLRLDFFIERLKLAFEFDGIQHEQFNPFFHGDRYKWLQSQNRDDTKEKWCKINGIILIRITDKDLNIETIRKIINERGN